MKKLPVQFMIQVLRSFRRNQGLLLSGAVAYYSLLSIIPIIIVFFVVLSHIVPEHILLQTVYSNLSMLVPDYAAAVTTEVRTFIQNRHVIGAIGFLVMLFFSSLAFTVLENAMAVIFLHRTNVRRRHFLVSAVIPYVYILLLGIGLLVLSIIAGMLDAFADRHLVFLGLELNLAGAPSLVLYILGIAAEVIILTSMYLVMPMGRITFTHAVIGGLSATLLWEITRRVLVWYYSNISLVNLIYGSLATAVVSLLSIEAAAVILLLGAQVIAELDRNKDQ